MRAVKLFSMEHRLQEQALVCSEPTAEGAPSLGVKKVEPVTAICDWTQDHAYECGDLVIHDKDFYRANCDIDAGTEFKVGTTGQTWEVVSESSVITLQDLERIQATAEKAFKRAEEAEANAKEYANSIKGGGSEGGDKPHECEVTAGDLSPLREGIAATKKELHDLKVKVEGLEPGEDDSELVGKIEALQQQMLKLPEMVEAAIGDMDLEIPADVAKQIANLDKSVKAAAAKVENIPDNVDVQLTVMHEMQRSINDAMEQVMGDVEVNGTTLKKLDDKIAANVLLIEALESRLDAASGDALKALTESIQNLKDKNDAFGIKLAQLSASLDGKLDKDDYKVPVKVESFSASKTYKRDDKVYHDNCLWKAVPEVIGAHEFMEAQWVMLVGSEGASDTAALEKSIDDIEGDVEALTKLVENSTGLEQWKAHTVYATGDVVIVPDVGICSAKQPHNSEAAFKVKYWNVIAGSVDMASIERTISQNTNAIAQLKSDYVTLEEKVAALVAKGETQRFRIIDWQASHAYKSNDVVVYDSSIYRRKSDGTTGATFNAGYWEKLEESCSVMDTLSTIYGIDDIVTATRPKYYYRGQFTIYGGYYCVVVPASFEWGWFNSPTEAEFKRIGSKMDLIVHINNLRKTEVAENTSRIAELDITVGKLATKVSELDGPSEGDELAGKVEGLETSVTELTTKVTALESTADGSKFNIERVTQAQKCNHKQGEWVLMEGVGLAYAKQDIGNYAYSFVKARWEIVLESPVSVDDKIDDIKRVDYTQIKDYSPSTRYELTDVVYWKEALYRCIESCSNISPNYGAWKCIIPKVEGLVTTEALSALEAKITTNTKSITALSQRLDAMTKELAGEGFVPFSTSDFYKGPIGSFKVMYNDLPYVNKAAYISPGAFSPSQWDIAPCAISETITGLKARLVALESGGGDNAFIDALRGVAPEFSASTPYPAHSYVKHEGKVYTNGTSALNAVPWNTALWQPVLPGADSEVTDQLRKEVDVMAGKLAYVDALSGNAPEFDSSKPYPAGSYVMFEHVAYVNESNLVAGKFIPSLWFPVVTREWEGSIEELRGDIEGLLAAAESISAYSSTKPYRKGEMVIHQGCVFGCRVALSTLGAWNTSQWSPVATKDLPPVEQLRRNTVVDVFSTETYYTAGMKVFQDGQVYECKVTGCSPGGFSAGQWKVADTPLTRVLEPMQTKLAKIDTLETGLADLRKELFVEPFSTQKAYGLNDRVIYNKKTYRCKVSYCSAGGFSAGQWEEVAGDDEVGMEEFSATKTKVISNTKAINAYFQISNARGHTTSTVFKVDDIMFNGDIYYRCKVAHTATSVVQSPKWDALGTREEIAVAYRNSVDNELAGLETKLKAQKYEAEMFFGIKNVAEHSSGKAFAIGDKTVVSNVYYVCKQAHTSGSSINVAQWTRMGTKQEIARDYRAMLDGSLGQVAGLVADTASNKLARDTFFKLSGSKPFQNNHTYVVGDIMTANGEYYTCKVAHTTTHIFIPEKWTSMGTPAEVYNGLRQDIDEAIAKTKALPEVKSELDQNATMLGLDGTPGFSPGLILHKGEMFINGVEYHVAKEDNTKIGYSISASEWDNLGDKASAVNKLTRQRRDDNITDAGFAYADSRMADCFEWTDGSTMKAGQMHKDSAGVYYMFKADCTITGNAVAYALVKRYGHKTEARMELAKDYGKMTPVTLMQLEDTIATMQEMLAKLSTGSTQVGWPAWDKTIAWSGPTAKTFSVGELFDPAVSSNKVMIAATSTNNTGVNGCAMLFSSAVITVDCAYTQAYVKSDVNKTHSLAIELPMNDGMKLDLVYDGGTKQWTATPTSAGYACLYFAKIS